jgi:hypothetical protein
VISDYPEIRNFRKFRSKLVKKVFSDYPEIRNFRKFRSKLVPISE